MLDLDDTLFLERDYVKSGFDAVGRWVDDHFSIADFSYRAYERFEQGCRNNIFDIVLAECDRQPDAGDITSMISAYRTHEPNISLLPDATEFLAFCKDNEYPLALITDGSAEAQRRKVKALAIEHYFAVTVFTEERRGWSKPNLYAFRHVAELLGERATFCYVADNPTKDFWAPRQLGWIGIRIRREQGIYSELEAQSPQAEPDYEISHLGQLQSALVIALRRSSSTTRKFTAS